MEQPIRVLQIVTHMNRGGLETMLMNYYRHIDRSKIQFDFLTHRPEEEKKDYDDEIRNMGGKIYHMPALNPFNKKYLDALRTFFKEHPEYQIVHSHLDCMSAYPLKIAKECGVPVRIAHAHTSKVNNDIKKMIKLYSRKKIPQYATAMFACSRLAGDWMFGKNTYELFYNAIDVDNYVFDEQNRKVIREELMIPENTYVIGHVGNFTPPKNHDFIIDLFSKIANQMNTVLVLVGDGERKSMIEQKIKEYGLTDKIILTGRRGDIAKMLSAFDVFVLPSLFEGFPVALIEAQASGLKCIISQNVTKEAGILPNSAYIDLDDEKKWTKELTEKSLREENAPNIIKNAGFDIDENAKWLEVYYLNANR